MRFVTLLLLGACSAPAPLISKIDMDFGAGCSPEPSSGVDLLVMARAGTTTGLGFHITHRSGGDLQDLAGTSLDLYVVEPGVSPDLDGPATAGGVVGGDRRAVIHWRPMTNINLSGGTDRQYLLLHVDGFDLAAPVDVDIQRPHSDGRDIICAYAANAEGRRIDQVRSGDSVRLRARGIELGVGARIAFEIDGQTLGDTELDSDGWGEIETTLDLSSVGDAPLLAVATLPAEPAFVRERPLPVTVR